MGRPAIASASCEARLAWSDLRACAVDLRPGGAYRFEFPAPPGEDDVTIGHYLAVAPPRHLAFTWDGVSPCGDTGETLDHRGSNPVALFAGVPASAGHVPR